MTRVHVYRTRRIWSNLVAWAWSVPLVVLATLVLALRTEIFWPLWAALAIGSIGGVIAFIRDLGRRCTYRIDGPTLHLDNGRDQREVEAREIMDVSPLDRRAGRDYILQHVNTIPDRKAASARVDEYLRYCSVDIGMRSLSMGIGRRMIDRMPKSRYDLVLLRLFNGQAYLLSPAHSQDMADGVGRMLRHADPE